MVRSDPADSSMKVSVAVEIDNCLVMLPIVLNLFYWWCRKSYKGDSLSWLHQEDNEDLKVVMPVQFCSTVSNQTFRV